MHTLKVVINGTEWDLSAYLSKDFSCSYSLMGNDFKSVRNSLKCSILYHAEFIEALNQNRHLNNYATFKENSTVVFYGTIEPLANFAISRTSKVIELKINDLNTVLDVPCPAITLTNAFLCLKADYSKSVLHQLLAAHPTMIDDSILPNLNDTANKVWSKYVPIATFISDPGKTIFENLSAVCSDNGHYFYFTQAGKIKIGCYAQTHAAPDYDLTDLDTINGSVSISRPVRDLQAEDSIKVYYRENVAIPQARIVQKSYSDVHIGTGEWDAELNKRYWSQVYGVLTTPEQRAARDSAIALSQYIDNSRALLNGLYAYTHLLDVKPPYLGSGETLLSWSNPKAYIKTNHCYKTDGIEWSHETRPPKSPFNTLKLIPFGSNQILFTFLDGFFSRITFNPFGPSSYSSDSLTEICIDADVVIARQAPNPIAIEGPRKKYKTITLQNCYDRNTANMYAKFYSEMVMGGQGQLTFKSYNNYTEGAAVRLTSDIVGQQYQGIIVDKSYDSSTGQFTYKVIMTADINYAEPVEELQVETYDPSVESQNGGTPSYSFAGYDPETGTFSTPIQPQFLKPALQEPTVKGVHLGSDGIGYWDDVAEEWKFKIDSEGNALFSGEVQSESGKIGNWIIDTLLKSAVDGDRIELNPEKHRIEVWGASIIEPKVAMGYLEGLTDPRDRLQYLPAGTFGFWSGEGESIKITGEVELDGGQFSLKSDQNLDQYDTQGDKLLRFGVDQISSQRGIHWYGEYPGGGNDELYIKSIYTAPHIPSNAETTLHYRMTHNEGASVQDYQIPLIGLANDGLNATTWGNESRPISFAKESVQSVVLGPGLPTLRLYAACNKLGASYILPVGNIDRPTDGLAGDCAWVVTTLDPGNGDGYRVVMAVSKTTSPQYYYGRVTSANVVTWTKIITMANLWPIGSFYTQHMDAYSNVDSVAFPASKAPAALWGGTWVEIYADAGAFLRTRGGNSGRYRDGNGYQSHSFADHYHYITDPGHTHQQQVSATPNSGGSGYRLDYDADQPGLSAYPQGISTLASGTRIGVTNAFYGQPDIETRPVNYLMKIWKRTA